MKSLIYNLIQTALLTLNNNGLISIEVYPTLQIDRIADLKKGHFSTNIAMLLAKPCRQAPQALAKLIVQHIAPELKIEKIEVAGPGFINFYMQHSTLFSIIATILQQQHNFGRTHYGKGKRIHMEFVSSNPTGPLHVGHGRSAASGATIANLLEAIGYEVTREYYVNDAGRQMNILAISVWLRYLALQTTDVLIPANAYQGEYVIDIARTLLAKHKNLFFHTWANITDNLPADTVDGGDKDEYIDALVLRAQNLLGAANFKQIHQYSLNAVLTDIQQDLQELGVVYNNWFSEQSLFDNGLIQTILDRLTEQGFTYLSEGALWFKSTDFGDEKDRVLVRANGQMTYFASDVAYHWDKFARGFDRVIDLFGSDHHGYIMREKAAVSALGLDAQALTILLVQFAVLYRGTERIPMSTRSGSFVTLRELRTEVGNDAARFFYVMRKLDQHIDFDLELAKSQSNDNPIYYIQYAHARICSVLRQMQERDLHSNDAIGLANLDTLIHPQELAIVLLLDRYTEVIDNAATLYEPHQLAYYLRELATALHSYYNAVHLLCENLAQRAARVVLIKAVQCVLRNGMGILGVSSPETM